MADFDPKAFLAQDDTQAFDPKAFLAQKAKPAAKFTPDEDTMYSPEGMPLITPTTAAEPTGAGKTAQQVMTDVVGAPVRAGMSLAKPVANVMNMFGVSEPKQAIKQIDTGIKAQGPGEGAMQGPVGTLASLGGDIYSANKILQGIGKLGAPIASAVPALAPTIAKIAGSPLAQSTLGGGALGALESESANPLDVAKSTAAGMGLGAAGHGLVAGAGRMLDPALERLQQIKAQGFNVPEFIEKSSVGQFFGGVPQRVENFLSNIPYSGALSNMEKGIKSIGQQGEDLIAQAKMQAKTANAGLTSANEAAAIEKSNALKASSADMEQRLKQHIDTLSANIDKKYSGFSTDMINKSLEPIGAKLDTGVKGTDAIAFAQNKIGEAYNNAIPKIGNVSIGDEQIAALKNIAELNKRKLGGENGEYYNRFAGDIDDIIAKISDGTVSAKEWHNIFKDVGKQAFENKKFGVTGTQAEYGSALTQLKNAWMDVIEGTPGAELIKQANAAHSALQVPQTAAGYLKAYTEKGGEFDAKDFLRALKAEASKKKFSAGEARMQEEALATFEQMAKDKAILKAQEAQFKDQLLAKKAQEKAAMQSGNRTAAANLAKQREYLERLVKHEQIPAIQNVVETVKDLPHGSYADKRIGYALSGLGGGAGHYLASSLGIPLEQQLLGAGTFMAGSNLLNSKLMQQGIKNLATMERPQFIKDIGQGLQKIATPASLSAVQASQNTSPVPQQTALPVPQKEGGLVYLR